MLAAALMFVSAGCTTVPVATPSFHLEIEYNPYATVDWATDQRFKVQLHDHAGVDLALVKSYDMAGYDAIALMSYSGVASLSKSWKERRWPPADWFPQAFLDTLRSIKLFVPDGEEVGRGHVTSPFLTSYIAFWEPAYYAARAEWQYASTQECIDLIRRKGGIPILAHPWLYYDHPGGLSGFAGMEVYSAYVPGASYQGLISTNDTELRRIWDSVLAINPRTIGIGVNDHYGPYWKGQGSDPRIRDSGKTIILASSLGLASLRERLEAGAIFAVKDFGLVKDRYPRVRSIAAARDSVAIDADGDIYWIANGTIVHTGSAIHVAGLPLESRYLRAEIRNDEGSIVFTQPFVLRAASDAEP